MAAKQEKPLSVIVDGPDVAGETKVRRCVNYPDQIVAIPFKDEPDVNTLFAAFLRGSEKYADLPFLGHRGYKEDGTRGPYQFATYRQVYTKALTIGMGLTSVCGVEPKKPVGIYSINRPEWTTGLFGLYTQNMICVPLYDTLGANAVEYIVNHAELSTCMLEKSKLKNMLAAAPQCPGLKHIVVFEDITDEDKASAPEGVQVHSLQELIDAVSDSALTPVPPTPADLAYIMYTSGTTGDPKGVMLTHQNVLASAAGLVVSDPDSVVIRHDDVYISYLPLAHSFETCMQVLCMLAGARIGFFQGDVRKLVTDDIPDLRPTVMAGVPRVYSRIYDKITQGVSSSGFIKKTMFNWAFNAQASADKNGTARSGFWDNLVFSKVKARLGGRMRLLATGAAPMSAELQKFLRVVFGCPVTQGYGMTENSAAAFAMPLWFRDNGTVGGPLACTEFKLVDVEEMGYLSTDTYPENEEAFSHAAAFKGAFDNKLAGKPFPRGEIWIRGANVFQGYYKLEKETKETLTEDGWLKTGDIGVINPNGSLSIIDRKKNIFKLAQGEYVAAEAIEQAVGTSPYAMQVWIYGNSFKTQLVGVVTPDREVVMKWAQEHGHSGSFEEVCNKPEVKKMIFDDITRAGKAAKLKGFEFPKALHLETSVNELGQGFTVDNDTLTPTQKLRRPQLLKRYQSEIDEMYKSVGEA